MIWKKKCFHIKSILLYETIVKMLAMKQVKCACILILMSSSFGDVMGQWTIGKNMGKVQIKFTELRPKLIFKKFICWALQKTCMTVKLEVNWQDDWENDTITSSLWRLWANSLICEFNLSNSSLKLYSLLFLSSSNCLTDIISFVLIKWWGAILKECFMEWVC